MKKQCWYPIYGIPYLFKELYNYAVQDDRFNKRLFLMPLCLAEHVISWALITLIIMIILNK